MRLSIGEIAAACGGELHLNDISTDIDVTSVVLDSRIVSNDGVFVATVGERVDGHKFINDVFEKGVSLVICEKTPKQVEEQLGIDSSGWKSYVLVESCFKALKDIAEYYRQKLDIPVVGITGSVGKTSTKEFIAGVLSAKYNVLKTEGNFNNEVGVPLTLLRIRDEHEVAVIEMGISDFGEMHRLSKMVRPTVCVITNIGQCHLENLKSRDGILKAKTEIFDFMSEDGEVCLNGDDDKLATVKAVNGKSVHYFGQNTANEVFAYNTVNNGLWGSDTVIRVGLENTVYNSDQDIPVHVPLPGTHMVTNATAATCVGAILGLNAEEIKEGLSRVSAVGGRNNLIRMEGFTVIDDCYNANPVSMRASIDLLCMADTEKIAILGDMFELGDDSDKLHAQVGEYAAMRGIERLYCIGENSKHMYEAAVNAMENNSQYANIQILYFPSRDLFIKELNRNREELIPNGATVLLKASHGMNFSLILEELGRL